MNKDLSGLTATLIVDGDSIKAHQYAALARAVDRGLRIDSVLICNNTSLPRRPIRHAAYYLYKLLFLRGAWDEPRFWHALAAADDVEVRTFSSLWEGIWQRVPDETLSWLANRNVDVVIKFGMGLLRDPEKFPARAGVLSYHHGDPSQYRGRPAGFYEVRDGASHVGVMVQRLSNRLDGGDVMAFGSVRVVAHSYRRTLANAYRAGEYVLVKALRRIALEEAPLDHPTIGTNYTLPSNLSVAIFSARITARKWRRVAYGFTRKKAWRLAAVDKEKICTDRAHLTLETSPVEVETDALFMADPFVLPDGRIICEFVERKSPFGKLGILDRQRLFPIDTSVVGHGHLSYPFTVNEGSDRTFVLPEMSSMDDGQWVLELNPNGEIREARPLLGLEEDRLIDPTIHVEGGKFWLFATREGEPDSLFLWSSDELLGPYKEHPCSPIVQDPSRARPAGALLRIGSDLYRPGQDNRGSYGDGIALSRVLVLTEMDYDEKLATRVSVRGSNGPHTLTDAGSYFVVDQYHDEFDLWAGMHRIWARVYRA